ncbi:hypothetical protein DICVIV_08021 [Dictyocaulus viviparus]|uniref:Uncharacterized protein n=1 Tax=Dictyocaulus viviparus TaxID=29172 RepID=A0A0D8XMT0_DICVI|nr:hypothetical protein DICVIV_08021 [Dictyocaulus viviparus]
MLISSIMFKIESSQLKIAEKLVILNDRAVGMLTRIYNIKKACGDPKSRPAFLSDKHLENAIKHITRKFPVVDARMNTSTFHYVDTMKEEIMKSLGLYYFTFADLMDLKDNVLQLLTTMDACQFQLDISLNYELTAGYLNLVVNLICLMILLSRVDDRKIVLGLFNAAYDLAHGESETSFPRLGQMILDYDHPIRKLSEDLGPLSRLISSALNSLSPVYLRRNITANTWRNAQILSMTTNAQQILYAAQTDTIACEYLSLDVMDRWIILGTVVCHSTLLNDKAIFHLWQMSLQMGVCLRLFRDEIFQTHHEIQQFFDSIKGCHKRSQEVKDCYSIALQQSASIHSDRRRFLRVALRELCFLIKDQPGLLGPKVLFILWLLRHLNEWPSSSKKASKQCDELVDRQLPELLNYMLELRELVIKYSNVIQRYYLKYVNGYDAIITQELISTMNDLNGDEGVILSDFASSITSINSDTDLRALRLDWFRFQAKTSMARSTFMLSKNRKLAVVMNTNVFHLKMIDLQDEMIRETSDLSVYCFYIKTLEKQWKTCLALPSQSRFVLSFAKICGHFSSALHDMCPEEKNHILEKSLAICNTILDDVCRSITDVMGALCEYELRLAEQTSPSTIAALIVSQMVGNKNSKNVAVVFADQKEPIQAGEESYRNDRQILTYPDKLLTTLIELCSGFGQYQQVLISDHLFAPKEYLSQHVEHKFVELILSMAVHDGRYLEVVLRRASAGHMLWSDHLQEMVAIGVENDFEPEQYTDPLELRCLSQIIGPYGVKYLAERLTWHVASQIAELNKIVVANKEVLHIARTHFDCNERMKEVMQALSNDAKDKKGVCSSSADAILQRTAIIGQIFSFKDALHFALEQRLPFLLSSFSNLYCGMDDSDKATCGELGAALGLESPVDIALSNAVRAQSLQISPDEHYQLSCLLLVAVAISLPKLALMENAAFKPTLKGNI